MPDDLGKRVFEGAGLVGTGLHVMQAAATLGLVAVAAPAALPIVVTAEVTVLAVGSGVEHLVNYEAVAGKADKLLETAGQELKEGVGKVEKIVSEAMGSAAKVGAEVSGTIGETAQSVTQSLASVPDKFAAALSSQGAGGKEPAHDVVTEQPEVAEGAAP